MLDSVDSEGINIIISLKQTDKLRYKKTSRKERQRLQHFNSCIYYL